VTDEARTNPNEPQKSATDRRPWARPTLTAYGPIGKLTQGKSGTKPDGTSGTKSCL
jgi:hypothetical protein